MSNVKDNYSEDHIRLQHMLDAAQQTLVFMEGRSREDNVIWDVINNDLEPLTQNLKQLLDNSDR